MCSSNIGDQDLLLPVHTGLYIVRRPVLNRPIHSVITVKRDKVKQELPDFIEI